MNMKRTRNSIAVRCMFVLAAAVSLILTSANVFAANAEDKEFFKELARPKPLKPRSLDLEYWLGKERVYNNLIFESETNLDDMDTKPAGTDDLEKIAKMSSNPIGAAWMLWSQNDYSRISGNNISGGRRLNSTKFQPVMPFPVEIGGEDWNFLVRPVIQYQSVPLRESVGETLGLSPSEIAADPRLAAIATNPEGRTSGLGDTVLLTLLGPNRLDGTIWGFGATQMFPTASQEVLGSEKWAAGPAFLLAKLAPNPGGINYGALAQHWWSYAGEDDRESISFTNVQYFINYRLSKTELVGMSPNITYDWNADDSDDALTLPVGMGYSNTIKMGKLPVRFAVEYQYFLESPDNMGEDWNIRFMFIPIIPNPYRSY